MLGNDIFEGNFIEDEDSSLIKELSVVYEGDGAVELPSLGDPVFRDTDDFFKASSAELPDDLVIRKLLPSYDDEFKTDENKKAYSVRLNTMANLIAINISFQMNVIHSFNTHRPIDKLDYEKVLACYFILSKNCIFKFSRW